MHRRRIALLIVVAVLSFFSGGWLLQRAATAPSSYQQARLFEEVVSYLSDFYVDSLDEQKLYQMAIDGLLDRLNDPYTVFLRGRDYSRLREQTTGNYAGLGISIEVRDGWITVVAPLPETPADRAGINSGDRIVAIDGESTEGWPQDKAVSTLRGPAGSQVKILVRRPGLPDALTFTITRAQIHVRSVQFGMMLGDGVGYVRLTQVSEPSTRELTEEIVRLKSAGMRSLVLDLRDNPGGLLEQGVQLSDLFLNPGQEIVSTRGRAPGTSRRFFDQRPQQWGDLPIVVLTNGYSASAAEIIAGALQD
ncbi:MAG: S41 family peptidase, partial [Gemmatimonadales bacterium]